MTEKCDRIDFFSLEHSFLQFQFFSFSSVFPKVWPDLGHPSLPFSNLKNSIKFLTFPWSHLINSRVSFWSLLSISPPRFLPPQRVFESYSFLPFTVFIAIFWTFTYHRVPETKNRTFDEIAALFKIVREDDQLDNGSIDYPGSLDGQGPPEESSMSNGVTKGVSFSPPQAGKNAFDNYQGYNNYQNSQFWVRCMLEWLRNGAWSVVGNGNPLAFQNHIQESWFQIVGRPFIAIKLKTKGV